MEINLELIKQWIILWHHMFPFPKKCYTKPRWGSVKGVKESSVQFRPHGLQHARPPCPSLTPGVYSNSYPSTRWCHPTISSSVQSFPASGPFPVSQFFASGGQSIGASVSTSVLPMNTQDWSLLGWTGWILQSKGLWGPGNSLKNVFYLLFVVIIF